MKLSFSTKGWHGRSFEDFCRAAVELGFTGIELHNIRGPFFTDRDGVFREGNAPATLRRLYEQKLSIPCIDAICDPSDLSRSEEAMGEIPAEEKTGNNGKPEHEKTERKGFFGGKKKK